MGKRILKKEKKSKKPQAQKSVGHFVVVVGKWGWNLADHQLSHGSERRNLSLFLMGHQGPHGRIKYEQLTVLSLHLVEGFPAHIVEIILCIPKTFPVIQREEDASRLG